jgi:hypothetical protein
MGEAIMSGFERTFTPPSAPVGLVRLRPRVG